MLVSFSPDSCCGYNYSSNSLVLISTTFGMCKSKKMMVADVIQPKSSSSMASGESSKEFRSSHPSNSSFVPSSSNNFTASSSYNWLSKSSGASISSSRASLSSLRDSLPENPHLYHSSEISSATNNFLAKRYSSSSSSAAWRCTLRGNDVLVFQRKIRRRFDSTELQERLLLICKSHHSGLIKLRGASISGNYIYLVYDFVQGANLADCLRNTKNPNFTVLSNWISRVRIIADVAHGLDYIHHSTGLGQGFIHNHIKSSSIVITEPLLSANICHFGTAELCGEVPKDDERKKGVLKGLEYKRSDSKLLKFEGTRGYMSPEFQSSGVATQKSDVYSFGVVLLEVLSGEEALKYKFDGKGGGYSKVSVIETARAAVEGGGGGVRGWVDKRLKDSFPVEVAEKLARVGLECVEDDPEKRPDMGWVAGRVSKLYLDSQTWTNKMGVLPADFTVTLAPR